jgi:hypothetical protein
MSNCNNCNDNLPINVPVTLGIFSTACEPNTLNDIKDWAYKGVNLTCSEIYTGNSLETVIQKLDAKLCGVIGDFSSYNVSCLRDGLNTITTQQQFVESISSFVCDLKDEYDDFVNITFEGYQDSVDTRFKLIETPGITSVTQGFTSTSTLQNTLTIMSATIDNILNVKLDISDVDWNSCFVVTPAPTTIAQGFDTLIAQICTLQAGGGSATLPTFNNVGSCLDGPVTASDTLVTTVNKIKGRLCELPEFNINDLTWGCTTKPSSIDNDLQSAIQTILNTTNDYKQNKLTFSADFLVSATGPDTCGGKTISLAVPSSADRYVATNVGDTTPGTLSDKLVAGTNVTLDYVTTPGKVIITSNGGGTDVKVKTEVSDPTGGFLEDKIKYVSNTNGVSLTKTTDLGDHKVALGTAIDGGALWTYLLAYLDANPTTYAEFCERVTGCLPDCIIPPNVTVIYNTGSTTTTTTTTL